MPYSSSSESVRYGNGNGVDNLSSFNNVFKKLEVLLVKLFSFKKARIFEILLENPNVKPTKLQNKRVPGFEK